MKRCFSVIIAAAFFLGLHDYHAHAAKLTQKESKEFISSFHSTCIKGVNIPAEIRNLGGNAKSVSKYCTCVANYFVNNYSQSQIIRMQVNHQKAHDYCIKKIFK